MAETLRPPVNLEMQMETWQNRLQFSQNVIIAIVGNLADRVLITAPDDSEESGVSIKQNLELNRESAEVRLEFANRVMRSILEMRAVRVVVDPA